MADPHKASTDAMLELISSAQKFSLKTDLDEEIETLKRQKDAATKDAADARKATAQARQEADVYLASKRAELETLWKTNTANIGQAQEQAKLRLANMEANAQAALEVIDGKLKEKQKELVELSAQLKEHREELGKLQSAFQDAWDALGH